MLNFTFRFWSSFWNWDSHFDHLKLGNCSASY